MFRLSQIFFRAFETEVRKRKSQGVVGLFENQAGTGELVGEMLAHSGEL
jgi:hypothetical protein